MNENYYYLPAGETAVNTAHPGDPEFWDDGDEDAGEFAIVIGDTDQAALAIHGDLDALEEFALRILRNVHGARIHHAYPVKIGLDTITELAGRELGHDELIALNAGVGHSTVPEALADIVHSLPGAGGDEREDMERGR